MPRGGQFFSIGPLRNDDMCIFAVSSVVFCAFMRCPHKVPGEDDQHPRFDREHSCVYSGVEPFCPDKEYWEGVVPFGYHFYLYIIFGFYSTEAS